MVVWPKMSFGSHLDIVTVSLRVFDSHAKFVKQSFCLPRATDTVTGQVRVRTPTVGTYEYSHLVSGDAEQSIPMFKN